MYRTNIFVLSLCQHKYQFYPFVTTNIGSIPLPSQIFVLSLCQQKYFLCPFISTNINSFSLLAHTLVIKNIGYISTNIVYILMSAQIVTAQMLVLFLCQKIHLFYLYDFASAKKILVLVHFQQKYWFYSFPGTNNFSITLPAEYRFNPLCKQNSFIPLSAKILVLYICQHKYRLFPFDGTNIGLRNNITLTRVLSMFLSVKIVHSFSSLPLQGKASTSYG